MTGDYVMSLKGAQFSDAWPYSVWLLQVPSLLIELNLLYLSRGVSVPKSAIVITAVVTAIATYHRVRIPNSWVDAFLAVQSQRTGDYVASLKCAQFYAAWRYVVWLLQVPSLLIELNFLYLSRGVPVPKSASVITGVVTAIATYHLVRFLNSWVDAC